MTEVLAWDKGIFPFVRTVVLLAIKGECPDSPGKSTPQIHRLAYRRANHPNIHVRGYKEMGNINTPLELAINNQIDRFNLSIDVIDRVPALQVAGAHVKEWLKNQIVESINYSQEHGIDKPEFTDWKWPYDRKCGPMPGGN